MQLHIYNLFGAINKILSKQELIDEMALRITQHYMGKNKSTLSSQGIKYILLCVNLSTIDK